MCYKPITMVTPSKQISLYGGQQIKLQFGCGKCCQCLQKKQLEYHYRTYYECQDAFLNGGYVMAVTLTYRPKDVPRLSNIVDTVKYGLRDCMLFDYSHYQKFLKVLRMRLKRLGYKNVVVRYFLTSEYGTDPKGTHRPHYHILFYVSSKDLHPYKLSKLISDCWPYGRTDGVPYKPMSYVRNYTFGYYGDANKRKAELLRVCNYVSKYVTKCSEYQNIIDSRIKDIYECCVTDELGMPVPAFDDETIKNIVKSLSMCHKQSQGYGLGYLTNITEDERNYMLSENKMRIPSSDTVVSSIRLPLYYIRKLYYRLEIKNIITYKDGVTEYKKQYRWILTDKGVDWKSKYLLKNVTESVNKYEEYLLNMPDSTVFHISDLLNGRSLLDFSVYINLFKNRLKYPFFDTIDLFHTDINVKDICKHIVTYNNEFDDNSLNKYNSSAYSPRHFVTASNTPMHYDIPNRYAEVCWMVRSVPFEDIKTFISGNVYDDTSFPEFKDFDKIDNLFKSFIKENGISQQNTYDSLESLKKRFKYIYNAPQVINL